MKELWSGTIHDDLMSSQNEVSLECLVQSILETPEVIGCILDAAGTDIIHDVRSRSGRTKKINYWESRWGNLLAGLVGRFHIR